MVLTLMTASAPATVAAERVGSAARLLRLAFLGPPVWLESCCPPDRTSEYSARRLPILYGSDVERTLHAAERFAPHVSVVFDPVCLPAEGLHRLPGTTLGVLVGGADGTQLSRAVSALDRVLSFRPELTGVQIGSGWLWRAIPPPVGDALFGDVRPLHRRPRTMVIGRSTEYREHMLMPAKHHHDLLQVIHGVSGEALIELLRDYDVGVYVAPEHGGGFGVQVGMHLAAGQLLFAEGLDPAHGLERGIDYVHFNSPEELVWALERLARFPEMYQRLRVRGRMKAERYRASRLFHRIAHDLLADVAAFGSKRAQG
jgi:hypothetical protein